MYATKKGKNLSIYRKYQPKTKNYQDAEMEFYIAHAVGQDISKDMKSIIRGISAMVVHGFSTRGD